MHERIVPSSNSIALCHGGDSRCFLCQVALLELMREAGLEMDKTRSGQGNIIEECNSKCAV